MEKPRIGLYVCHCGTNISKMVDVKAIADEMKDAANIVITRDYKYMCSDPGQDLVIKDIKENNLNRIVVAACSPRIHELTFRKALQKAGLNPYMLQMANIREHVSWVHTDKKEATKKAKALVSAAARRVNYHEKLDERSVEINPATLVIGGGIAGLTAALEIADAGKKVFLVERSSSIGGLAAEIDLTFPYFSSTVQMLQPMIKRIHKHENIELFLNTEVGDISGYIGNFETIINNHHYKNIPLQFGNIIIAIGLKPMDPAPLQNYGYGRFDDIITSVEFEKMLRSGIIEKKNGEVPENIAIIHCVGSRNDDNHSYCSRTCCMTALKYANQLRSALPGANIYELYADMRAMGKGCEELYAETSRRNIMFLMFDQRNDLPEVKQGNKKDNTPLIIELNEKLSGERVQVPADMIILMTAMEAQNGAKDVAHAASVSLDGNNFFIEKHPKLDPVATTTNGVYVVGSCQSPKDIPDSVSQARAAAARVLGVISKGTAKVSATTAYVNPSICCGCQMCISVCPYLAISFNDNKNVSVINEVLCQGCGTCVALCRPKAINLAGGSHIQVLNELTEILLND